MSYDLEVRSDDRYSQSKPSELATTLLRKLGAQVGNDGSAIYQDENRGHTIEIDFGDDGPGKGTITFIGFGLPYAYAATGGSTLMELAFAVAADFGWRVYDPQLGRYVEPSDEAAISASLLQADAALDELTRSRPDRGSFLLRVLDRLIRQTRFTFLVAVLAFGSIAIFAAWSVTRADRPEPRRVVGRVLVAALAAIVLRPILMELVEREPPAS
jgi:hypothetical protein